MQRHRLAGIGGRRAGHRGDVSAPQAAQPLGEIGLRLHQHAAPAGLLELPALRAALRFVGADLDEKALAQRAEKLGLEPVLDLIGKYRAHRLSSQVQSLADRFAGRARSTIAVVECPGTSSTRITSPPAASTTSWPTTPSRW